MGILKERREEDVGFVRSDDGCDLVPRLDRVQDLAVLQAQHEALDGRLAFGREDLGSFHGFALACGRIAEGCGLAVGDVEQENVVALGGELGDGATHAQFLVVRVRADDEDIGHAQYSR